MMRGVVQLPTDIYILALSGVSLLLLIFCLILFRKLRFLTRRYQSFMADANGASLEGTLQKIHAEIREVNREVMDNRSKLKLLAQVLDTSNRGIGVVRFNAFQDTGSDLSFAVAYLDAHKNGVVISSIYGREESRTYAKPVEAGLSIYPLSREEQEAITRAADGVAPLADTVGKKSHE
jgi:hypothetical protein